MHRLLLGLAALTIGLFLTAETARAQRAMAHKPPHPVAAKPAPGHKQAPKAMASIVEPAQE